jgi:hypothetical protein
MPEDIGETVGVIKAVVLNVPIRIGADRTDITPTRYGVINDIPDDNLELAPVLWTAPRGF